MFLLRWIFKGKAGLFATGGGGCSLLCIPVKREGLMENKGKLSLLRMKHIHMIAPSYPVTEEEVKRTKDYFQELRMRVTVPPDLLGEDLLCAHQDEKRFSHLTHALNDTSVDIIWLMAGGYGLTRLIPRLFHVKKPKKEKLFIGFSDGTALHVFLNQIWGWSSLHGVTARQMGCQKVGAQTIDKTLRVMREGLQACELPSLRPLNEKAKGLSALSGRVVGGNLCLLGCSLGTKWQVDPRGKILFLEDVEERGYRVDRLLTHLQQAHIFEETKAILLGDFTGGEEADGTSLVPPVLERFAENIDVPIFSLLGCGHGKENFPLPLNRDVKFLVKTH